MINAALEPETKKLYIKQCVSLKGNTTGKKFVF